MSIRSKIQALIAAANAKTGESDATLTDAMQTLVDGYGQGGGGEWTTSGIAGGTEPSGAIRIENVSVADYAMQSRSAITSVHIKNTNGQKSIGQNAFANCGALVTIVGENISDFRATAVSGDRSLTAIDVDPNRIFSFAFQNASNLQTIVLRRSDVISALLGTSAFNNTPFKSGGTGGTIYIPKALYDHLGDGSALDYKAATNWSTIDGYGTITWAQIEGSQYEHFYADGTPIE